MFGKNATQSSIQLPQMGQYEESNTSQLPEQPCKIWRDHIFPQSSTE